ncbi:phosphotransferase family protein [Lasallia pustulata]|uniref:Phosphotransferase family protein n=1 Tax=Lasallia pustulata TaxID=136370 RepID=A0A1W5CTE6_9LECA|nr:phosphotransferase family protein [Lasallia pustulata]
MSSWSSDLFDYTGGRFLFNEELRRAERRLEFDVDALAAAICRSLSRPVTDLASITKLAEGGFNRVLQVSFTDGHTVLARLPFRITAPAHYAVASEAATLGFLRNHGLPVPKVLGYSSVAANPVGTEYLLLGKVEGRPLSEGWFTMDTKARVKIMRQIVEIEKQFLNLQLPACGSLYYRKDLTGSEYTIPIPGIPQAADQIVVGPTAQYEWWYRERATLDVDRGPWTSFLACFEAPAKREIEFCKHYGKPRLHVERYLREVHGFQEMSPAAHAQLLSNYSTLAPRLDISPTHRFSRPVLRHPDFSPSNILVSASNEINWGDPMSEKLAKPETKLPDNFQSLELEEQQAVSETMRKRIVHFYYAALTMRQMPDHFDALRDKNAMLRAKLFDRAGAPWEGDSLSLRYAIIQAQSNWPMLLGDEDQSTRDPTACPVKYSENEIQRCVHEYDQEGEKMQELEEMREFLNIDALGWVPDDEQLEKSKALMQTIKSGMLEHSSTEAEKIAVRDHFPFDDHDDDV